MNDDILEKITKMLDVLLPIISTYRANKVLKNKIHTIQACASSRLPHVCFDSFPSLKALSDIKTLQDKYNESFEHKEHLENKAKTLVAASTISTTLIVSLHETVAGLFEHIPIIGVRGIFALIVIYAVGYMVAAGLSAIRIFTADIGAYIFTPPAINESDEYKRYIMLNELTNLIRSNNLLLSFNCLSRSFMALFFIFSVLIIVA